jgi:uncharacterized membrane protein
MKTTLLKLKPVAQAPRFQRRKRARFFARAFYNWHAFLCTFMTGVLAGIGFWRLVTGA